MGKCPHTNLTYMGEQKTDIGVNTYYNCTACGYVVVVTPTESFAIKGKG